MYRLLHFECKNFIGLYNGLNKEKVILDLSDFRDKTIFIILGGNAKGKTTLLSILHPFSGTTDKRDKFIRSGKEGYKELIYEKQDDPDTQIRIRHVYVPNRNGGHSTKSYIYKIIDGEETNLNPNGNVSTFNLAIEQEFGITDDFLRLSSQNEDMVGLVKMTGANRKDHMYTFLPKADDTTVYQKVVARKYRDVKVYLSSIVDKLGKMADEVEVQERLRDIEKATNKLVEKRDKTIAKLNKYRSQINALDPDDSLSQSLRAIKSGLKELSDKQERHLNRYNKLVENDPSLKDISVSDLDSVITNLLKEKDSISQEIVKLDASLSSRRQIKSSLYDTISEKESTIRQLSGDQSKEDIQDLLKEYRKRLEGYDKKLKNLNTSLTADDLVRGIDILENLRQYLFDIYNNSPSEKMLINACDSVFSNKFEAKYEQTKAEVEKMKDNMDKLTSSINSLSSYEYLKESINKRPKDCVIDTCEFLQDYHKWTVIEKKIDELEKQLNEMNNGYSKLFSEMEDLAETHKLKVKVEAAITFYRSNRSLISKLPFNDSYSTEDKLIKRILKYDSLAGAENGFYDIIEILQEKEEYEQIRNVKIPLLETQLKSLNDNDGLVDTIKSDIERLQKKYEKELEMIDTESDKLERLQQKYSELEEREEMLIDLKERLSKIEENKKEIIELSNKFDQIRDSAEKINKLKEKIEKRKQKLKVVEGKLKPLTKERDAYKYQEIKIQEYKMEKEILEENLKILSLIRDALSTNKGMVVDIIKMYVDEIRRSANMLLSETFDGTLYLETFEINEKEFKIPFQHNGDRGEDISDASSSEKSFISTCLSMAIIEQIISNYGILNLDEVDAGFSQQNKAVYCTILMKQVRRVGISQVFMITHSKEFYEPYDVGYVLFPGHNLNTKGKDYIKMY